MQNLRDLFDGFEWQAVCHGGKDRKTMYLFCGPSVGPAHSLYIYISLYDPEIQ